MSDHSFNPFIAKKYGVIESIIINSLVFWTRTNAAKESNFYEGRYWCFGTPAYFAKYFPYLTPRQIKYVLEKLVNSGALLKGNFNKQGYDRTNWFSLSDSILSELNLDKTCLDPASGLIEQNCLMHRTKLSNASDKIVRPIPVTKPVTKPVINTLSLEEFDLEQNLYTNSEQQQQACHLREKCLVDEKCKAKYEQLPEDTKSDKSFVDVLNECIAHYATQSKPQLVSPPRLLSWINREISHSKREMINTTYSKKHQLTERRYDKQHRMTAEFVYNLLDR